MLVKGHLVHDAYVVAEKTDLLDLQIWDLILNHQVTHSQKVIEYLSNL